MQQEEQQKNDLIEQEVKLKDVLINRVQFSDNPLDDTIYQTDLVIKIKFPIKKYVSRPNSLNIASLINKPSEQLSHAYTAAFRELYQEMDLNGEGLGENQDLDVNRKSSIKDKINKKSKKQVKKEAKLRNATAIQSIIKLKKKSNQDGLNQNTSIGGSADMFHIIDVVESLNYCFQFKRQKFNCQVDGITFSDPIYYNCLEQYTGKLDAFIINLNTLIYVLQHNCQFKVRGFLFSNGKTVKNYLFKSINEFNNQEFFHKLEKQNWKQKQIFLLLHTPNQVLMKAANKYHIKKEIFYPLIDPLLNEPMDKSNRPLSTHSEFNKKVDENDDLLEKNNSQKDQRITQHQEVQHFRKKAERKLKLKTSQKQNKVIIGEEQLPDKQLEKYENFLGRFIQETKKVVGKKDENPFNSEDKNQTLICEKEIGYLKQINRGKYNRGVEKVYMQTKKQQQYIKKLTETSRQGKYKTFVYPRLFVDFQLLNKKKSFFDRLRYTLLYKPHIVSPQGDMALFNKMERIKLAYLILRENVKIENFHNYDAQLFALNDDFEKYGITGDSSKDEEKYHCHYVDKRDIKQKEKDEVKEKIHLPQCHSQYKKINGGIYGTCLAEAWKKIMIWKIDFRTLRGYLGQAQTYEIFVKTKLLEFFSIMGIFGIGAEIIKNLVIKQSTSAFLYIYQVIFYAIYLFLLVILFSVFMATFSREQQLFLDSYQQKNVTINYRSDYKGPYIRNKINDQANDHATKLLRKTDKAKSVLFFLLVLIFVGLEVLFYYLIRFFIITLSQSIEEFDRNIFYLFYPVQLIGYLIFFLSNELILNKIIFPFFRWLTKFENQPTHKAFEASVAKKIYIVLLAVESIGPIDLIYIQYSTKSYCSSFWCYRSLEAYAIARYFSSLMVLFAILFRLLYTLVKKKGKQLIQSGIEYPSDRNANKLLKYLHFVYYESQKSESETIDLFGETISLVTLATLVIVFPLGGFISFLLLMLEYIIERQSILNNYRRIIQTSVTLQKYSGIIVAAFHWMIIFNISMMIIGFQWFEYVFQDLTLVLVPNPTISSIIVLKYLTIIIFFLIFQLVGLIIRSLVNRFYNWMEVRKNIRYKNFSEMKIFNSNAGQKQMQLPIPIKNIGRTFNELFKETNKKNDDEEKEKEDKKGASLILLGLNKK